MSWHIRRATEDDAAEIAALVNEAYRVEDFFKIGDRTDTADVLHHMVKGRYLVAVEPDGSIAGSVYLEIRGPRGYFGMLSSRPSGQGRGLGRFLVARVEELAIAEGCTEMTLSVVDLREELFPWYRKLGYRECGAEPWPFGETEPVRRLVHFVLLSKPLSRPAATAGRP